jgi:DNA-directed RNA polymerase specialized sigma24 family protein
MNGPTPIFGDEEMTAQTHIQLREEEANLYARREDFQPIFSVTGNRVFREWARSWAKRTMVQNAIRELNPRPRQSNSPLSGGILPDVDQPPSGSGEHFEINPVLRFADFDRFVFIMSVLEHYSERDCAHLLGCSARDIREGRTRALKELADLPHMEASENQLFVQEKK